MTRASLALAETDGDLWMCSYCFWALGANAETRGDLSAATPLLKKALELFRQIGDRRLEATTLVNLGNVAQKQDDLLQAGTFYQAALALRRDLGNPRDVCESLHCLADLAAAQAEWLRAARLLGASETWGEAARNEVSQSEFEEQVRAVRRIWKPRTLKRPGWKGRQRHCGKPWKTN